MGTIKIEWESILKDVFCVSEIIAWDKSTIAEYALIVAELFDKSQLP